MSSPSLFAGLAQLRRNWGWFLALGIALSILGLFALSSYVVVSFLAILFFGWLLVISGVMEIVSAFFARQWSGFFLHILVGILDMVIGGYFVTHPVAALKDVTLVIAILFVVGGIYRIVSAVSARFPHWGLEVLSGLVTLILGTLLWAEWPVSALWFIGMCIGIDLIFRGAYWISFALRLKSLPAA